MQDWGSQATMFYHNSSTTPLSSLMKEEEGSFINGFVANRGVWYFWYWNSTLHMVKVNICSFILLGELWNSSEIRWRRINYQSHVYFPLGKTPLIWEWVLYPLLYNLLSSHYRSNGECVHGFVSDIPKIGSGKYALWLPHQCLRYLVKNFPWRTPSMQCYTSRGFSTLYIYNWRQM